MGRARVGRVRVGRVRVVRAAILPLAPGHGLLTTTLGITEEWTAAPV